MSLTSTIKTRFQNLILGDYAPNASFSISTGRFRLYDRDAGQIENGYDSTTERRFQVICEGITPIVPVNHIDGYILYDMDVIVKVSYFYTHLGDDLTEGTDEVNGTGYYDDVIDRINTDFHDIQRVLTYYGNYGGLTPEVFNTILQRMTVTQSGNKLVCEIRFKTSFQAGAATSYV